MTGDSGAARMGLEKRSASPEDAAGAGVVGWWVLIDGLSEGGYYPVVLPRCTLLTRCVDLFWWPNLKL